MGESDSANVTERLQRLALDLSGRLDDDALNSAREFLAESDAARAAEMLLGSLIAGRIPVLPAERDTLREILEATGSEPDLTGALTIEETLPAEEHRFTAAEEPAAGVSEALRPALSRLPGVHGAWCTWRSTPAGAAYGAVPQRVLLAEVAEDGFVAATAYQLLDAVRHAGVRCAVEVFRAGTRLPEYHAAALSAAVEVDLRPGNRHEPAPAHRHSAEAPTASTYAARTETHSAPDSEPLGSSAVPEEAPAAAVGTSSALESAIADNDLDTPLSAHEAEPDSDAVAARAASGLSEEPIDGVDVPSTVDAAAAASADPTVRTDQPDDPARDDRSAPVAGSDVPAMAETPPAEAAELTADAPADPPASEEHSQQRDGMRVPAAVDAKLTDRERNLLRKLHEELAQREQHDPGSGTWSASPETAATQQDPMTTTMPGTMPPIAPASPAGYRPQQR